MNERINNDADLSHLQGDIPFGPFKNKMLRRVMQEFG